MARRGDDDRTVPFCALRRSLAAPHSRCPDGITAFRDLIGIAVARAAQNKLVPGKEETGDAAHHHRGRHRHVRLRDRRSRRPGKIAERQRLSRDHFLRFFADRQPATVLIEACGSAHHWARQIEALGHHVLLLPPHRTRPYVTGNKTDRNDAKALLEANRNELIRHVPVKSLGQQALAALHRLRAAWLAARIARINTVRGLLREFGITIPRGSRQVLPHLQQALADPDSDLPVTVRPALHEACSEILELEQRLRMVERQLQAAARQTPAVPRLRTIPGVGLITATALVAFVGDVERFPSARHFASYLGLTPRERSSGLRRRLGPITKRGDGYLRMLLTHGARSVLWQATSRESPDRLRAWARRVAGRHGHNKAAIALANKLARVVWAVWRSEREFTEQADPVT